MIACEKCYCKCDSFFIYIKSVEAKAVDFKTTGTYNENIKIRGSQNEYKSDIKTLFWI